MFPSRVPFGEVYAWARWILQELSVQFLLPGGENPQETRDEACCHCLSTIAMDGNHWETMFLLMIGDIGDDIPIFRNGDLSHSKPFNYQTVSYEVQESKSRSDLPIWSTERNHLTITVLTSGTHFFWMEDSWWKWMMVPVLNMLDFTHCQQCWTGR